MLINPPADVLGTRHAIVTGTGSKYYVPSFEGCLSLKAVVAGEASWESGGRRFVVREGCFLVLNDRQRYRMTIDSGTRKTTTFCLFFARGFVEDIWRAMITPDRRLLENPSAESAGLLFLERLETAAPVLDGLRALRSLLLDPAADHESLDGGFQSIAANLILGQEAVLASLGRLPAARAATRSELCKRLLRGRDLLLASWDQPLRLAEIAREACLSPYHFHRTFTRCFGRTPHRLLTEYRLERVAEQLRRTERGITELCFAHGFGSVAAFSSRFRQHFGVSARQYRRDHAVRARIREIA
jgi:AraC-like DNA-binding protein